ncbi:hypothetical protein KVP10_08830 [Candidimonas humi]|uniref:Bacteriocin biosynthesis cyclodehydratase domain-containing protein n=1 Tax=Candidimonas humi TaxID=683355 RepID=A0ABV8NYL2_9BURK|nr:hypothetical protein [Candidimonas humi]MBV6304991.1 hypothetical protein [Candidimonas humi]
MSRSATPESTATTARSHSPASHWVNSPAWVLLQQEHAGRKLLVLSGGADETYIVDEATPDAVAGRVLEAWREDRLGNLLDDADCGAAARQICRVGALIPARARPAAGRYALAWLDEPWPELAQALDAAAAGHGLPQRCEALGDAELVVAVRRNGEWRHTLDRYLSLQLQVPHLFIDAAYHHTLCIGPYVVPGQTACIACLGNRVARRWGDMPGPERPEAARHPQPLAALLAPMLAAPAGLLPFIEHSASLNLQTLAGTRDKVFQLPRCPACGHAQQPVSGALPLPWSTAAPS